MKLQIDNLDGAGLRDYTAALDAARTPKLARKLNQPSELRFSLLLGSDLVVPARGARVLMGRANGQDVFTGYITADPEYEFLGWSERGVLYRYNFIARSDEVLLDEKRLPWRSPFVVRSAGDALRQLTEAAIPGAFDTAAVADLDLLPFYNPSPGSAWSEHAAAIGRCARASYRVTGGEITFVPLGAVAHVLDESAAEFSPQGLTLQPVNSIVNDLTLVGETEPQDWVTDYFVGDGLTTRFHLSQTPFVRFSRTVFNEEYAGVVLDPTRWKVDDPSGVVSVSAGKLQVAGGSGADGATTVSFVEKVELGGASVLQHGDVVFEAVSTGILGGLYWGGISLANCVAGFRATPAGAVSQIQAVINGAPAGVAVTTSAGHRYALTTRIYSREIYRRQQVFHSARYPAGSPAGGAPLGAGVRLVLEVHDVDPANPGSMVAPSTVLYDGVLSSAPGFCAYALINSSSLHCAITFTRVMLAPDTEVRSALPGQGYRTRLVGPLSSGAECNIYSGPALDFFNQYVPALNELIEVRYRGAGRAMARVTNPASISAERRGIDDGIRGAVLRVQSPPARTSVDCENAALALLADAAGLAWLGSYQTWSGFLPGGATDIFPGDAVNLNVPSRSAACRMIVNEVEVSFEDLAGEHSSYQIRFLDAANRNFAFEFDAAKPTMALNVNPVPIDRVGSTALADLSASAITQVTSTTATIDAGIAPPAGGGCEVRWSDAGWGPDNDQNLAGRFSAQTFTLPRLSRVQNYFLRQYDAQGKYSRYSAALRVDYPY